MSTKAELTARLESAFDWAKGDDFPQEMHANGKTRLASFSLRSFNNADLESIREAGFRLVGVTPDTDNRVRITVQAGGD